MIVELGFYQCNVTLADAGSGMPLITFGLFIAQIALFRADANFGGEERNSLRVRTRGKASSPAVHSSSHA
jgi:hypothetical protein